MKALHMTFVVPFAALFLLSGGSVARAQTVGAWDARASIPAPVSTTGNLLAYPGSGDLIYERRGDDNTLNRYSISGDAWSALADDSCGAAFGNFIIAADAGHLYGNCVGGFPTDFIRYDIISDSWTDRATSPLGFGVGAAAAWDGGDFIYTIAGNGSSFFYRYSISGDSWSSMAVTPGTMTAGASLAYPGSGDYIYALRGGNFADVYRYSISGDSWDSVASTPFTVGGGGSLVVGTLFAFNGISAGASASDIFWSYDIALDAWSTLAVVPVVVGPGGSLVHVVTTRGDFLYGLTGNAGTGFYRYTESLVSTGGGSGGSVVGPIALQGALRRTTPPASLTDIVAVPGTCDGTCGVNVTFANANLLSIDRGQPVSFVLRDGNAATPLATIAEPSADPATRYTMTVSGLAQNAPMSEWKLCAVRGSNESCAFIPAFWTSWSPVATMQTAVVGRAYRMAVNLAAYANTGVGASGVALALYRVEPSANVALVPTSFLALAIDSMHAAFSATLAQSNTAPIVNKKTLIAQTFQKSSGTWIVPALLPSGSYELDVTPSSGDGSVGQTAQQMVNLSPVGEPITVGVAAEANAEVLRTVADVALSSPGATVAEVRATRGGSEFRPGEAPVTVRLTATVTLAAGAEQFAFVLARDAGGAYRMVSASTVIGNVTNSNAGGSKEFPSAATKDVSVAIHRTDGSTGLTVTTTGAVLRAVRVVEETPAQYFGGGDARISVTATDVFGHAATGDATAAFPEALRITAFDITSDTAPESEGDVLVSARIENSVRLEAAPLLVNLGFSEEGAKLNLTGGIPAAPKSALIDVSGMRVVFACENGRCAITGATAADGAPIAVIKSTNGTVRAGDLAFAFNPERLVPIVVGVSDGALKGGSAIVQLSVRYPSFGMGSFGADLALAAGSRTAERRATFLGTGVADLFPEINYRNFIDLLPTFVYYPALQIAPLQIQSVVGGYIVPPSVSQQLLNIGAPVSPLLDLLRNAFGGGAPRQ